MSESDKIKTFFKRALGVVSTFKDTQWYNEVNGRQRNIIEAKDINIEKTPELPEWSDSSLNSSSMATLGFDLDSDDFASSDSSFTDLHTSLDDLVVTWENHPDPGSTNGSVTFNYGGVLQPIDTTTTLTFYDQTTGTFNNWENNRRYMSNLSNLGVNFDTAVATFNMNTNSQGDSSVTINNSCKVFAVINESWTGDSNVDMSQWTLLDHDYNVTSTYIESIYNVHVYTRDFAAGTYNFDNYFALYIFQPHGVAFGDRTYRIDDTKLPGMYLDESVSDSSGVVALFVRLKLDKMEGDENLDPSAIAYTKNFSITNGDFEVDSDTIVATTSATNQFDYVNGESGQYSLPGWDTHHGDGEGNSGAIIIKSGASTSWANTTSYSGNYFLAIQRQNSYISKTVYLRSGKHILSYAARNRRSDNAPILDLTISQVNTSGTTDQLVYLSDDLTSVLEWQIFTTSFDLPYASSVTIQFKNMSIPTYDSGQTKTDHSFFLDAVKLTPWSQVSILSDAYEFSYKTQTNVGSIDVFKPYNYTLEYSNDDSNFYTVANNIGNWTFDTNSGTILFEHDPSLDDVTIDLSNGDLYFTFTKYVGLQGLENLVYYKDGKIGIGTKNPQYELDVSGSVNITGNLDVEKDLTVGTSTLFIDSTTGYIGINKKSPTTALDVSGDVNINSSLTTTGVGTGPGFAPIGSIIMWPTISGPDLSYGTWELCNGNSFNRDDYQELYTILGSENLPNYSSTYVRGPPDDSTTDINSNSLGNNSISFQITEEHIPFHHHNIPSHTHTITDANHTHSVSNHEHGINVGSHAHNIKTHSTDHNVNTTISHNHSITDHAHTINATSAGHSHSIKDHDHEATYDHHHTYKKIYVYGVVTKKKTGGGGGSNVMDQDPTDNLGFTDTDTGSTQLTYSNSAASRDTQSITYSSGSDLISLATEGTNFKNQTLKINATKDSSAFNLTNNTQVTSASVTGAKLGFSVDDSYKLATGGANNSSSSTFAKNPGCNTSSITLNTNAAHVQTAANCTIEPTYHTLFFFIRMA